MKKNQDVGAIAEAKTFYEKLSAAVHGKKHRSRAVDVVKEFLHAELTIDLIKTGEILKVGPDGDFMKGVKATKEQMDAHKVRLTRCKLFVGQLVINALRTRNKEFFLHLAEECIYGDRLDDGQASRVDVLVLKLKYDHEDTWPSVAMTRADLEVYLAKNGQGGIDPKTLTAVIRRTGIKLTKDKRGPRAERRKSCGSGQDPVGGRYIEPES